jgi:hypothetical protein
LRGLAAGPCRLTSRSDKCEDNADYIMTERSPTFPIRGQKQEIKKYFIHFQPKIGVCGVEMALYRV